MAFDGSLMAELERSAWDCIRPGLNAVHCSLGQPGTPEARILSPLKAALI